MLLEPLNPAPPHFIDVQGEVRSKSWVVGVASWHFISGRRSRGLYRDIRVEPVITSVVTSRTSFVTSRTSFVTSRTSFVSSRTSFVTSRTSFVTSRTSVRGFTLETSSDGFLNLCFFLAEKDRNL